MSKYILLESTYNKNGDVYIWGQNIKTDVVKLFKKEQYPFHFYIPDSDGEIVNCYNKPVKRLEFLTADELWQARQRFKETYDADVPLDMQFRIEHGIKYAFDDKFNPVNCDVIESRCCFYDIEVLSSGEEFPKPEDANFPIVIISAYDTFKNQVKLFSTLNLPMCEVFKTEKAMIEAFAKYISANDFSIISGWYSHGFDNIYIFNRAKKLKADISGFSRIEFKYPSERDIFPCRTSLDMMELFKKWSKPMGEFDSYSLKYVAKKMCDFSYDDYGAHIDELVKNKEYNLLWRYSTNDAIALHKINNACGLIKFYEGIRKMTGCRLSECLQNTRIIETYLMHEFKIPLPTRKKHMRESFKGAYVKDPIVGIHHNVASFDLFSLYPQIILGYNVSPDAFNMIPISIKKMMDEREKLRDMKMRGEGGETLKTTEQSLKYIINSFYGVMGFGNFKLFDMECAKFIPLKGQEIIKEINKYLESENKLSVVYGDSVSGDTKLNILKNGVLYRNILIESLFTDVKYSSDNGKEYSNLNNISINSIDNNGNTILCDVPYIMRHKVNKQMYRVWLNNTEYVDITEDHSIFGYINSNKLKTSNAGERIIPVRPTDIGSDIKSLIVQKELTTNIDSKNYPKEVYELLGLFLADGSFTCKQQVGIKLSLGNDYDELVNKIIIPLQKLNYISSFTPSKSRVGDISIGGVITKFINSEMRNSNLKKCKLLRIPEFIFHETLENRCAFLRGLFDGDGTIILTHNNPIVRFTSISKELCEDVKQLLLTVGISSSIFMGNTENIYKTKDKTYTTGSHSYYVRVKSIIKFADSVKFNLDRKQTRLLNLNVLTKANYINSDFDLTKIYKIEPIEYNDYVYDLSIDHPTHRYFLSNGILVSNTDSSYVMPINDEVDGKVVESAINEHLIKWAEKDNCSVAPKVKFETLYRKVFFKGKNNSDESAKKRYIGHVIWEDGFNCDKLGYKGIELKRSDVANITKEAMMKFFTLLLIDDDEEGAINYLKQLVVNIETGKINLYDCSIPRGVKNKELNNPHNRGRENLEKLFKIKLKSQNKPRLIYCKRPCNEICIDDTIDINVIVNKCDINWKLIMEKTIKNKFESILSALNRSWSQDIDMQSNISRWL